MSHLSHSHPSAERIQAFLDGELPSGELASVEEHLAVCPRCSSEVEAWQALFHDLGELPAHRPHEGFARRVMSNVSVPEPRPLAARLRERVAGALAAHEQSHVPADVLQDFLDGSLAARRAQRIEEHLAACQACTTEADAWLGVMRRLDGLGSFAPAGGFADAVLDKVTIAEPMPLAARLREAVGSLFGSPVPEHVPEGILQDFVDGALPATAYARVEAHVDACGPCSRELDAWRLVAGRLGSLERLEPDAGFAERVMIGFEAARAAAPAAEPASPWSRSLVAARRGTRWAARGLGKLIPETRQAVAALSGAAVTPMVVLGLAVWALASHPTLTVGALLSFAWWQVSDLASAALETLAATAASGLESVGLYSLFETVMSAPTMVGAGVLIYTAGCALALRVLYKNLFADRPSGGRHVHASTAS